MATFPANCPLGKTYFYDSGHSGVPSLYYTYAGDPVDIASDYYECVHNDADPPVNFNAILTTPAATAISISVDYFLRVQNIASSIGLVEYRVVQAGAGMSGIILASFEIDATFGPLDVYFRTYDNSHTLLNSVVVASGVPNPFSVSYSGTVHITRVDTLVSTYYVYLDGVLITTYTDGALSGPVQIQQELRYDKFFAGAIGESRFKAPYFVGAGFPQICYGIDSDLFPNLIVGL